MFKYFSRVKNSVFRIRVICTDPDRTFSRVRIRFGNKILIGSEKSGSRKKTPKNGKYKFKNNKKIGPARGLVQITESTLKILKDRKGEIKDHYVNLKNDDLFDPNLNICAAIRWLFRKNEILEKRLKRTPEWEEVIAEYKGLGNQLKNGKKEAIKIINDFKSAQKDFRC